MIIGVDLGTTNSAVAYIDDSGQPQIISNQDGGRTTPSIILFEEGVPIVGKVAKDSAVSDPMSVVQFIKRQMGNYNYKFATDEGTEYTPEELSAIILKRLKKDAEAFLGQEISQAVVTVPAYFDDAKRKATQDAGKLIGLDIVKIINEPTAAALAYGISHPTEEQNIFVYDLGGGTFDATIMTISEKEIMIRATGGDKNLGGFDFDNVIIDYVVSLLEEKHGIDLYDDEIALQDLREKAENCKIQLSVRKKTMFSITSSGITERITIEKDQYEKMIEPLLQKTDLIMDQVLEDANMMWKDIDKILLVGGSTKMPMVSTRIEQLTGIIPSKEVNPDEVVAMGAALQASMLEEIKEENNAHHRHIIDVNSHSIGIIANDINTNQEFNSIILKRNTPMPAKASEIYTTVVSNQEFLRIRVTEGEDADIDYVQSIGESIIPLPKGLPADTSVEIEIAFDENQIVHIFARLVETGQYLGEMHIERQSNLTEEDINNKSVLLSKLDVV